MNLSLSGDLRNLCRQGFLFRTSLSSAPAHAFLSSPRSAFRSLRTVAISLFERVGRPVQGGMFSSVADLHPLEMPASAPYPEL